MPRKKRLLIMVLVTIIAGAALAVPGGITVASDNEAINSDIAWLIAYVLLALTFSFLCSVAEAVLLSITPSYIEGLREERPSLARLLTKLKHENVDQSLVAILTMNTIAHTVGAIAAGAKAAVVFGSAWFGLFSALMTLMILFLSEILPKTLGVVHWRKLTRATAYYVNSLIVLLYPLVWVSELFTRVLTRKQNIHVFSRKEFIAMADLGKELGEIKDHEYRIIRSLFRFGALRVKDVMTPRTVIAALQKDQTVAHALRDPAIAPFSRIPLYGKSIDDIVGFILKDDLLLARSDSREEVPIETIIRDIVSVSEDASLSALFESLIRQKQHIALVINEHGGTEGIVSLEDIVETLLGMEIVDEMDQVDDMRALARQQWQKRIEAIGLKVEVNRPE